MLLNVHAKKLRPVDLYELCVVKAHIITHAKLRTRPKTGETQKKSVLLQDKIFIHRKKVNTNMNEIIFLVENFSLFDNLSNKF